MRKRTIVPAVAKVIRRENERREIRVKDGEREALLLLRVRPKTSLQGEAV
jgi:hypothetical protein